MIIHRGLLSRSRALRVTYGPPRPLIGSQQTSSVISN
nr:MAG TPA: hypothetical protein [Caudoviricetes sp.]